MHEVPELTALPPIPPLQAIVRPLKGFGSPKEEARWEGLHWTSRAREADKPAITIADMNRMVEVIEDKHVQPDAIFVNPDAYLRFVSVSPRTGPKITNLGEPT